MTGKSDFYFFFLSFVTRLLLFFIVDSLSILSIGPNEFSSLPFVRTRILRNSRTIVDLDQCRIVCLHDSKIQKQNVKLPKKLFFTVSQ
jgi:hypothetical protein